MTGSQPTIADIQTADLIYYDKDYIELCNSFCAKRDIDCLPEVGDSGFFYQHNPETGRFDRHEISADRRIEAATPIFRPDLLERFRQHPVQFVFDQGVLTGIVHYSDYNRDVVGAYLYTRIARYERDLRDLLQAHGLKNDDMIAFLERDRSKYGRQLARYKREKEEVDDGPKFQSFYLDDLIELVNHQDGIGLHSEVKKLRNAVMHAHQFVDMDDWHTPDYIYNLGSFEKFFNRVTCLLTDSLRVHNRLAIMKQLKAGEAQSGAGEAKMEDRSADNNG